MRQFLSRTWVRLSLLLLAITACVYFAVRQSLPKEIRIATAAHGGLYAQFAERLGTCITQRTGRAVKIIESKGTIENRELLLARKADLAIMQGGAASMEKLAALAPLYLEPMHVIARKGRGITSIRDLQGKSVILGPPGSGMRESALRVLEHYRVDVGTLKETDHYFGRLAEDAILDAAIVTTGVTNPDLAALLTKGEFELLPILDAEALALHHPFFSRHHIPRGLYDEGPPVPPEDIATVATTAMLAAREDAPSALVSEMLAALFESDLKSEAPILIPAREAANWPLSRLHPAARSYYDPYGGLGILSNLMQSLAAIKELLFAFGAGLYLLWTRSQSAREREKEAEFKRLKERLDQFVAETVRIERAQLGLGDPQKLREYLREVTLLKLKALEELTHEDLRGDRLFTIFLMQCANLIDKMQRKLSMGRLDEMPEPPEEPRKEKAGDKQAPAP